MLSPSPEKLLPYFLDLKASNLSRGRLERPGDPKERPSTSVIIVQQAAWCELLLVVKRYNGDSRDALDFTGSTGTRKRT